MNMRTPLKDVLAQKTEPQQEAMSPRPGRANKRNVTGYFAPEVSRQLRILAAMQDTTVQALLGEAIDDLFEKNGLEPIASRKE